MLRLVIRAGAFPFLSWLFSQSDNNNRAVITLHSTLQTSNICLEHCFCFCRIPSRSVLLLDKQAVTVSYSQLQNQAALCCQLHTHVVSWPRKYGQMVVREVLYRNREGESVIDSRREQGASQIQRRTRGEERRISHLVLRSLPVKCAVSAPMRPASRTLSTCAPRL